VVQIISLLFIEVQRFHRELKYYATSRRLFSL